MTEVTLRQWHRRLGLIFALFLFVQAVTGFLAALENAFLPEGFFGRLTDIHTGGGLPGSIYRMLLGLGLITLVLSGTWIYLKIRARTKKARK